MSVCVAIIGKHCENCRCYCWLLLLLLLAGCCCCCHHYLCSMPSHPPTPYHPSSPAGMMGVVLIGVSFAAIAMFRKYRQTQKSFNEYIRSRRHRNQDEVDVTPGGSSADGEFVEWISRWLIFCADMLCIMDLPCCYGFYTTHS
jgi:hypothetical protein